MTLYTNKYCVYLHKINGDVFYVGMGIFSRTFHYNSRGKLWKEIFRTAETFEVEILAWYDTALDAAKREAEEIRARKPRANSQLNPNPTYIHNKSEAGRKGAFRKWAKISKHKRSQIMRDVANARYHKTIS